MIRGLRVGMQRCLSGRWQLQAVALLGVLAACSGESGSAREPPEAVFLISLDTLRADYLNLYGYERFEISPALDRFARESVVFDNCVVAEPRTLTSHMSLMTGLHPHHHRVDEEVPLAAGTATLASTLRSRGWTTRGWADGGYLARRWGFDRGFDGYRSVSGAGLAGVLPAAKAWLERGPSTPFFVFLHTYDVHNKGLAPFYQAPAPFRGRFSAGIESALRSETLGEFSRRFRSRQGRLSEDDRRYLRATYAEGVRYVDDRLGAFLAFLRERNLYDRSLIVVWSDHGEGLFDHDEWAHGEVYDHNVRCALLTKIPSISGGRRIRAVLAAVDLLPTILELVGVPAPPGLDGRSAVPEILEDSASGVAFSQKTSRGKRRFSVRTPRHHLIWDGRHGAYHFFDLANDPGEARDLSPSGTETEAKLVARLAAWVRAYDSARGRPPAAGELPRDAAVEEELRALGYLE